MLHYGAVRVSIGNIAGPKDRHCCKMTFSLETSSLYWKWPNRTTANGKGKGLDQKADVDTES